MDVDKWLSEEQEEEEEEVVYFFSSHRMTKLAAREVTLTERSPPLKKEASGLPDWHTVTLLKSFELLLRLMIQFAQS